MRRLFLSLAAVIALPMLLSQSTYADYELDVELGKEDWQYTQFDSTSLNNIVDFDNDGTMDFEMLTEGASVVLNAIGEWVFYNQMWTSKNEPYTLCSYDIDGPQMWVRRVQRATVDTGSEFVFLVWNLGTKQYYYATIDSVVNGVTDWIGQLGLEGGVSGVRQHSGSKSCGGVATAPGDEGLRVCLKQRSDATGRLWGPASDKLAVVKIKQPGVADEYMDQEVDAYGNPTPACFTYPNTPEEYHLIASDYAQDGFTTSPSLLLQQVKMCVEENGEIVNFQTDNRIAALLYTGFMYSELDGGSIDQGSLVEPFIDTDGCYYGDSNSPDFPLYRFNFWKTDTASSTWEITPETGSNNLPFDMLEQWQQDMATAARAKLIEQRREIRRQERRAERRAARVEARRAERKAQRQADREAERQENIE